MNTDKISNIPSAQVPDDCIFDCPTIYHFMRLTDEMVHAIIRLEEELIRWRQALVKYLPPDRAEGLQLDILDNLSRDFEGNQAYDLYVSILRGGHDPQHDEDHLKRMRRLINGTDETSITDL